MTDREMKFAKMAELAYRELTDQRPQWEARSPAMAADFERLNATLDVFNEIAGREGVKNTKEYSDARDRAEHAAEAASGRIVRGLRVLQLNAPSPSPAAAFTPSTLNPLHGPALLAALRTIAGEAAAARELLAHEGVTDEHLRVFNDAIGVYAPMVDLPNGREPQGKALDATARQVVKQLRAVLHRLDVRIDNLRDDIPGLARRYDDARRSADPNYVPGSSSADDDASLDDAAAQ